MGDTFLLLTVGETGWPHVAMLSVGEVLAVSTQQIRFALWPDSHTSDNLRRTGLATLMAVTPPLTYLLRLRCEAAPDIRIGKSQRAVFDAVTSEVFEDTVAYAEVSGGISFRLAEPDKTIDGWRATLRSLRKERSAG